MVKGERSAKSGHSPPADEGFLGRWSRRKAQAKTAVVDQPAADAELPAADAVLPAADAEQESKRPAAAPVLPDIDKMGPRSDFSVFMQAGVPSALKTKALRKLWRVKPELANLDGLLDYGEDLTGSFKVVDHLKTAYQVGKGFLRDLDDDKPKENEPDLQETVADISANAEGETEPADIDREADCGGPQGSMTQDEKPRKKTPKG